MKMKDRPIEYLELSARPAWVMKNSNIKTISDLLEYSRPELRRFTNFGKVSANEVEGRLGNLGLQLRDATKKRIWIPGYWHYFSKRDFDKQ